MDKEDVEYTYIHTHNGILLSHKKNKIMPFAATWMNLEIIILSEVSQTKYITYRSNLKNDTNELICKTEIDSDIKNKFTVTRGEGREE